MLDHISYRALAGLAKGQSACTHDTMKAGSIHAGFGIGCAFEQADHIVVFFLCGRGQGP